MDATKTPVSVAQLKAIIDALKSDLSDLEEQVESLGSGSSSSTTTGSGVTSAMANSLWAIIQKSAYATALTDAEKNAFKTAWGITDSSSGGGSTDDTATTPTLSSISAVANTTSYNVGTSASNLDITVTGTYSDGSTQTITGYSISGSVLEGTNTFTITYSGKSTTVTVTGVAVTDSSVLYELASTTVLDGSNSIDTGIAFDGNYNTNNDMQFSIMIECEPTTIGNERYVVWEKVSSRSKSALYFGITGSGVITAYHGNTKDVANCYSGSIGDTLRFVIVKEANALPRFVFSVNGVTKFDFTYTSSPVANSIVSATDTVKVGQNDAAANSNNRFIGNVNVAKILNRALTSNEIDAFIGG